MHDLVVEIAVFSFERYLLFIAFLNLHLIVRTSQIEPTQLIKRLANKRKEILVLDSQVIEILIIHTQSETIVGLFDK